MATGVDGARKVLGGNRRVLDGQRRVLGGCRRVLDARRRVLDGIRRVLGGTCRVLMVIGGLVLSVAPVVAQDRPGPLRLAVREAEGRPGAVWLTYRVPIVPGPRRLCFENVTTGTRDGDDLHLALPPVTELTVYVRISSGRVERVHAFTPECQVDAGTTPVVAVAGVSGSESADWLASLIGSTDELSTTANRVVQPALLALSMHAEPAAITRLITIARDDPRSRVRGQALFWLAERAGDRAAAAVGGAVDNDPDIEVRKKAVFALSQLPHDEGVPKLIEVARSNRSAAVRKQAFFWLGQSKDSRALQFLEEVLTR